MAEFVTVQKPLPRTTRKNAGARDGPRGAEATDRGSLMGLAATAGGDLKRFGLADFMFSYEPCALPV